ncbi:MAG: MATE family efflux transporter [Bacillota bacterium]
MPALLLLSWPIVLSNLLQTAYNIADTFWLGRLGDHAVAAISVSFPIIFLFISLGAGLTIAGTALVAQYIGAEREADANYIASQTVGFVFVLAVILSFLGYWFCEHVVSLMGPEPDVFADAVVSEPGRMRRVQHMRYNGHQLMSSWWGLTQYSPHLLFAGEV